MYSLAFTLYVRENTQLTFARFNQERMGPSKERSPGQRTFLSLALTGDVLFGVHFENDCNGC